ncbi:BnaC08g15470D [Brassica napus]|uniref:BnaC08g15470D protein n=1 Tax=Brassica napus TaxID=3708 RepID=A0A078H176_BRANA|nr:BnaC08g15470D [Brassica napus]
MLLSIAMMIRRRRRV